MNKIRILLVEDDPNLGSVLQDYLQLKGYEVELAANGAAGLKLFKNNGFSLCILDVMMPVMDGFALAENIRKTNSQIPIIFLTAKSMIEDKIKGFNIGADDYIVKPFSTEELLLRIKAVMKRVINESAQDKIVIGSFVFYPEKQLLENGSTQIKLTFKENSLLKLLAENINQVVQRDVALENIWTDTSYFTARSMDVYISKLRNYFKSDTSIEIINIHGCGYKLMINC